MSRDYKFHAQMKHIDIWYHFIHKAVKDKKTQINYIMADENVPEILQSHL